MKSTLLIFPFGGSAGMKLRPVLLLSEPIGNVPKVLSLFGDRKMHRFTPLVVFVTLWMCPTATWYAWGDGPTSVKISDETRRPTDGEEIGAELRHSHAKPRRD